MAVATSRTTWGRCGGSAPPGSRAQPARAGGFDWFPYRLILPVVAIEGIFVLCPLAIGVWYSFHRVEFLQIEGFVGLANYLKILASPSIRNSLLTTAVFAFFSLFFTFAAGFALAVFMERDTRWNVFGRAVVLVPHVISMLVGSMLLKWIFSNDGGLLPMVTSPLGLGQVSILADPGLAMGALVFNAVWRDSAFAMILLMAGLKSVPLELFAAARVDGAGAFYQFRRITLPLLRVPIMITAIRLAMHFVNVLTFALVLTAGGPADATTVIGLKLYQVGFSDYDFGLANALAFLMFLFNIAIVLVLVRFFREKRSVA
jgi:ABC-type sugar transport system permease subunit